MGRLGRDRFRTGATQLIDQKQLSRIPIATGIPAARRASSTTSSRAITVTHDSLKARLGHSFLKNVSVSMPACLRMARSVPSGMSPG